MTRKLAIYGENFMSTVSIAEAKNQLPRMVHEAETGAAVHITRHGKPVAVLISEAEYARLRAAGQGQKSVWETMRDWRGATGFDWPDLSDKEIEAWRERTPPRGFSWDD